MTTTVFHRPITRTRTRVRACTVTATREDCFYCNGFPRVVTTTGVKTCPVCHDAHVE